MSLIQVFVHPLAGCLVVGLTLFKITMLLKTKDSYERSGSFTLPVLVNEARFYAYLLILYALSWTIDHAIVGWGMRLFIATLVLLSIVDMGVFLNFFQRLTLVDLYLFTFKIDLAYTFSVFKSFVRLLRMWSYVYFTLSLALLLTLAFFVVLPTGADIRIAMLLLLAAVVFYVPKNIFDHIIQSKTTNSQHHPCRITYYWVAENIIDVWRAGAKKNTPYSQPFAQHLLAHYSEPAGTPVQALGIVPKPNIILIILESFSLCHSKYLSGIFHFTPNLDILMRENIVFTNFYANGGASEDGLIALLSGELPLPSPHHVLEHPLTIFDHCDESVPSLFCHHGYETIFMTGADFASFGIGTWAQKIGFQSVISREDMHHDNSRAAGWNTATDEVLYLNAITTLQQIRQPYVLVLETGTTHEPFIDPDTGYASEGLCFRYADRKIYEFIRYLEATHFFDQGLVCIVSDHRRRRGVLPQEYERYGESAHFKIPMMVIDGKKKGRIVTTPYQQRDFLPSFQYLLQTGTIAIHPTQGIFLPEPKMSAKYIIARNRFEFFDVLNVVHEDQVYRILLDGDHTRCENCYGTLDHVVDYVNLKRISNDMKRKRG